MRSSSDPASWLYPTTSAARIVASFRVSTMTFRHNPKRDGERFPAEMRERYHASMLSAATFAQGAPVLFRLALGRS